MTTSDGRTYREVFCIVKILPPPKFCDVQPCDEIDEPDCAEVCVPYNTETECVGITCYCVDFPNWQPIPHLTLALANIAEEIVKTFFTPQGASE